MASLLWLARSMSPAIGFSPGLSLSRTIVKVIHGAIFCGEENSMEFPSKGITSPPSVTCSDKEQDVCSQTLLFWRQ